MRCVMRLHRWEMSEDAELMADAECGCPYHGAKEAYILDFSDCRKALYVIATLWEYLPFPKKANTKR